MNIAIIFAGGSGVRMGAGIPKQFLEINGKPVIVHTLQLFQYHREIDKIYIAIIADYLEYMNTLVDEYRLSKVAGVVPGGTSALDSVYHALKAAEKENPGDSVVLIHDGVRPFISREVISANIRGVRENGNAITCTPCFETILISEDGLDVEDVPNRRNTYAAQAPQSFLLSDIIKAHEEIRKKPEGYKDLVDSCNMIRSLGKTAHMIEGNRGNIKVTTPEDVYMFRALITYRENEQAFGLGITNRIGNGPH